MVLPGSLLSARRAQTTPPGGWTFFHRWNSATGAVAPASGVVLYQDVTHIRVSKTDEFGVDISGPLGNIAAGDIIRVFSTARPQNYALFGITNNADSSTYKTLTGAFTLSFSAFSSGELLGFSIAVKGAAGAGGLSGAPGADGTDGTDGDNGEPGGPTVQGHIVGVGGGTAAGNGQIYVNNGNWDAITYIDISNLDEFGNNTSGFHASANVGDLIRLFHLRTGANFIIGVVLTRTPGASGSNYTFTLLAGTSAAINVNDPVGFSISSCCVGGS